MDLERARRRRLLGLRADHARTRAPRASPRSSCPATATGCPASRWRCSRRTRSAASSSTACTSVPRGDVLGEVDAGFARRHAHPGPVPAQRRRVRRRHGPGGAGRDRRPRPDPAGVRRPAGASSRRSPTGSPTWRPGSRPPGCSSTPPPPPTTRGTGRGSARRSAMAKLFATETAQYVVDACVQLHGAVRCSAATCSSTSTATCARRGSTKAPPRYSAPSSPAS